mmetsp:Transcript_1994/g.7447  ORF Transcript_1994/g.7447 Transcript_1994/m.7447 type:complete len:203 (+) Transcript_1994:494-1102(+)
MATMGDDGLDAGVRRTTRSRSAEDTKPPSEPARSTYASANKRNARVTHRDNTMATSLPPSMAKSPSNSTSSTRRSRTASSHSRRRSSRRSALRLPRCSSCWCTMDFTASRSSGTKGTKTSIAPTAFNVSSRSSHPSVVHFSKSASLSVRCNDANASPNAAARFLDPLPPCVTVASWTSMNPIFASSTKIDRANVMFRSNGLP